MVVKFVGLLVPIIPLLIIVLQVPYPMVISVIIRCYMYCTCTCKMLRLDSALNLLASSVTTNIVLSYSGLWIVLGGVVPVTATCQFSACSSLVFWFTAL